MNAEEYQRRQDIVHGWTINITSYRIGDRYHCTIEAADPGARIARSEGGTREEAERVGLDKAAKYLAETRRFPTDTPG
jgi:hypothetical protein